MKSAIHLRVLSLLIAPFVWAPAGCSSDRPLPGSVPVSGLVTLDAKPLADGRVQFAPAGSGQPAIGMISAGRFTMRTTMTAPGVLKGPYKVSIVSDQPIGDVPLNSMGLPDKVPEAVSNIPKRYNSVDTSGFTVDVTGPIRDLTFELKSAE
jgi:hypothetical protein